MIIGHLDPGRHGHALAVGHGTWTVEQGATSPLVTYGPGELLHAAYCHRDVQVGRGPEVWRQAAQVTREYWYPWRGKLDALVVEVPEVYSGGRKPVPPNDLLDLAGSLAWLCGALDAPRVLGRLPREWTGGGKKAPRHARVRAALTPTELGRVVDTRTAADREDLWDAISLQKTRGGLLPLIWPG